MENNENISRELAHAFDKVVAAAPNLDPKEITRLLDDIAAEFGVRSTSDVDRLETKRRVAEWKFKLLCERDLPIRHIEQLHAELELLGYTNMEVEATIEIYFAQYLARNTHNDMARARLDRLLTKLAAAAMAGDSYADGGLIADAQRLRSRLDS